MEELISCTRPGWYSTVWSFFLLKSDVNIGTKDHQFESIWGSNPWTLDHNGTFCATETFQNAQLFCTHILHNYTDKRLRNINVIMHLRSWGWLPILFGPDVNFTPITLEHKCTANPQRNPHFPTCKARIICLQNSSWCPAFLLESAILAIANITRVFWT